MLSGSQTVNMAFVKYRFIGNALLCTTCACSSLRVEIPQAVSTSQPTNCTSLYPQCI